MVGEGLNAKATWIIELTKIGAFGANRQEMGQIILIKQLKAVIELANQVVPRVNLIIQLVCAVPQMVSLLWLIVTIIEDKDLMPVVDSSPLLEVKARMKINFNIHMIFAIFIIILLLHHLPHLFSW